MPGRPPKLNSQLERMGVLERKLNLSVSHFGGSIVVQCWPANSSPPITGGFVVHHCHGYCHIKTFGSRLRNSAMRSPIWMLKPGCSSLLWPGLSSPSHCVKGVNEFNSVISTVLLSLLARNHALRSRFSQCHISFWLPTVGSAQPEA